MQLVPSLGISRIQSINQADDDYDIVFAIREYAENNLDPGMHVDRLVAQQYRINKYDFNGLSGFAREWIMSHKV